MVGLIGMSVCKHLCDRVLMGRKGDLSLIPRPMHPKDGTVTSPSLSLFLKKSRGMHGRYKCLLEF